MHWNALDIGVSGDAFALTSLKRIYFLLITRRRSWTRKSTSMAKQCGFLSGIQVITNLEVFFYWNQCLTLFHSNSHFNRQPDKRSKLIDLFVFRNTFWIIWFLLISDRFHALGPIYYRSSNGAILVYDM